MWKESSMEQSQSSKRRDWKKLAIAGTIALIMPGGLILVGIYGIRKFLERRKNQKNV